MPETILELIQKETATERCFCDPRTCRSFFREIKCDRSDLSLVFLAYCLTDKPPVWELKSVNLIQNESGNIQASSSDLCLDKDGVGLSLFGGVAEMKHHFVERRHALLLTELPSHPFWSCRCRSHFTPAPTTSRPNGRPPLSPNGFREAETS